MALTLQYSGDGLFWRNYSLTGPSSINYALIPHAGKWDKAGIWTKSVAWNEPLIAKVDNGAGPGRSAGLLETTPDWEVPAVIRRGSDLIVRLFNAEGSSAPQKIHTGFAFNEVREVDLNGKTKETLTAKKDANGKTYIELGMPRFGIRTLQFTLTNSEQP